MLRRRDINGEPATGRLRSALAPAVWPFERLLWLLERRIVWPLRERSAGLRPGRAALGAAGLALVAGAAVAVGTLLLSTEDPAGEPVSAPVAKAVPTPPPPAAEPQGPVLKGAPPSFDVGDAVGVDEQPTGTADVPSDPEAGEDVVPSGDEAAAASSGAAAATSSSAKPVPAGPVAMRVARRFAEAFVYYELGERPERAGQVFGETATPQLAEALDERPPRQPQSSEVPQARVVNLVPGPRQGSAYTVSVSLLRVGLTSELRLEMRKLQGEWLVTDVRG